MWNHICQQISQTTAIPFLLKDQRSLSGGCINQTYQLIGQQNQSYFIKINQASSFSMFVAEALGLSRMSSTKTIRVPKPICWGTVSNSSYLVLEWLEFSPRGNHQAWEIMGKQLAAMHQTRGSEKFGWEENNTIGSTPQINTWTSNWADFFAQHRIGYQLKLAKRRGGDFPDTDRVVAQVKSQLHERQPHPSLVHGDLWSGNAGILESGEPVILDPATYYGDHEVDVAMTELFGGFPPAFYQGYEQVCPLDPGYQKRKPLYNLYHILNHFNLFGGGYGAQASRMLAQIL
ncbi:fructosamine kinase family protein [Gloeocapsa sp. PCC 73106]|uniref:fructosamine kinase family protein n=1 Tax=Gloeocapsa sp. PCC 73106 TaxID=102232 RepID=UPI0002ACE881|nr:fructosamine kinase family protein [Gloeocapsa sp. PCC 73106]ELR96312.1 fructosamine-3-kinase [Gloeocapsa sp. PCC 73106]